jgi:lysophospholipase L1-like esterase
MTRGGVARKAAALAAYGGGGISVLGGSLWGVLVAEAQLARRAIGNADGDPPAPSGWYGHGRRGPAIKIALIGDSSAAGYGVDGVEETPGAILASGVAEAADRRVYLSSVAKVGAQSKDLQGQIDQVLPMEPHVAVILIGANDVTHTVPIRTSQRLLGDAIRRLRGSGIEVVIGTCPDLGTIERVRQPLRWLARRASRQLAAAQTIGVVEQGGRTVSLGDLLGPEFAQNPRELFGPDNYHPSAEGYATAAMAVLPSVCAALGLWPAEEEHPDALRREGFLPVAREAAEAASEAGTEVAAAMPTGPRGPWALLKRRRRRRVTEAEPTSPTNA